MSSSSSSSLPTRDSLSEVVMKLLNKAGTDPRVTPRMLREKAEDRLKISRGTLKPMRNDIKDMVMEWHNQRMEQVSNDIKLLVKLAKAAGCSPNLYSDIRVLTDRDEQKKLMIERLKEKGLTFSDPPTEAEIEATRKEAEKKKDMDGIDTSNIVDEKKRRRSGEPEDLETLRKKSGSSSGKEKSSNSNSTKSATIPPVKDEDSKKYLQEDEEAQF